MNSNWNPNVPERTPGAVLRAALTVIAVLGALAVLFFAALLALAWLIPANSFNMG
ncbi:MAG TPA: hypothetical protein VGL20_01455 [Candidatus Dormibacteraeota bacterium]